MKRILFPLLALLLLLSSPVSGQVKRLSREAIDSIRNSRQVVGNDSLLSFGIKTLDFGTMYETDSARIFSFPFKNVSKKGVVIKNISTNCGCIHTFCEKYEYEPGEEGTVYVKFNPKGRSGTVDNTILVYTDDSRDAVNVPVARLALLGNVVDLDEWRHLPLSMGGSLRLKHRKVVFEPVKPGTSPQMRIPCANVGTAELRLYSRLKPDFVEFVTEPADMAPGEEGDMVIIVNGDKLPETLNGSYGVLIEGVDGRVSDRTVEIEFRNNKE